MERASGTPKGEPMASEVREVDPDPSARRRLNRFVGIVLWLEVMRVDMFLYLVELSGVLLKRCNPQFHKPVCIPASLRGQSNYSTCTHSGAIRETNAILIAV